MTTLADTLAQHNLSADDLEKAASVRIFQKVASAENIDLSTLSEGQIEELYAHFEENVLPSIVGGEPSTEAKIASLGEDDLIFLFDKQASAEGLDLSGATEEQLGAAFGYFLENVLPAMAENGFEPVGAEKSAAVEEAQAKLAEADILGRQMARGYANEMGKLAEGGEMVHVPGKGSGHVVSNKMRQGGEIARRAATGGYGRGVQVATLGTGALAGGGALALGAKKLMGRSKEKETTAGVQLSAEDVEILSQLAEAGDAAGLQKAASLIKSAAVAFTDAGHAYEAERGGAESASHGRMAKATREYTSEQPLLAHLQGKPLAALGHQLAARHGEYRERKHSDKRQSLNPFGGFLTKTKAEQDEKKADAVIDVLVEERASDLAAEWLMANGYSA